MPNITPNSLAGIKDAADVQIISRADNKPKLYINYANSFKISIKSDTISAKKKGQDAITWDKAKEMNISMDVEMLSGSLMSFILGSPMLNEMVSFYKREVFDITSSDQQVTLKETPKTGSLTAFKIRQDGVTHISEISSPVVATNKATLTGVTTGDKVAVYYLAEKQANHFTVKGKKIETSAYKLVAITTTKSYESGAEIPIEIFVPKVDVESTIDFTFDAENVSKFTINLKAMVDENDMLLDWKEIPTV